MGFSPKIRESMIGIHDHFEQGMAFAYIA